MPNTIKQINIFIASSNELAAERDALERQIWKLSEKTVQDKGIQVVPKLWENLSSAFTLDGSQEDYNRVIRDCHVLVWLAFSKVGQYTAEEFDVALEAFKKSGGVRPKIYTFFKNTAAEISSLTSANLKSREDFQKKLSGLKHFYANYDSVDKLQIKFREQFDLLDLEKLASQQPGKPIENLPKTEFKNPNPDALAISIENGQTVTFFPPHQAESKSWQLSKNGFSGNIASILLRFMPDKDLLEGDFPVLGEALFRRILPNLEARKWFCDFFLEFEKNWKPGSEPLKIVLHFDEKSSEFAALPWEYLFVPKSRDDSSVPQGFFLAEKECVLLSRRLPGSSGQAKNISPARVRILFVISKPAQTKESQKLPDEAEQILQSFDFQEWEAKFKGLQPPEIVKLEAKSVQDFKKLIVENAAFHVVHFIGKGIAEKNKEGGESDFFLFESGEKLSPEAFVKCFGDEKTGKKPNLLFLHAIRDSRESIKSLRKMAMGLVNKVDGVLALQLPADGAEIARFSAGFYTALASGQDLDLAASMAARDLAKSATNRLRMYGISASFMKESFRIVVEAKPKPAESNNVEKRFYMCPNWQLEKMDLETGEKTLVCNSTMGIPFKFNEKYASNCPTCDAGPLWICPFCMEDESLGADRFRLTDIRKSKCGNTFHKVSDFLHLIPEGIRRLANLGASAPDKAAETGASTIGTGKLNTKI